MKDFFDVWLLAHSYDFDGRILAQAVTGTFGRRRTEVDVMPVCFAAGFAESPTKEAQWSAFVRNSKLTNVPIRFADAITVIAGFAVPVLEAVAGQREFAWTWRHPGPWTDR